MSKNGFNLVCPGINLTKAYPFNQIGPAGINGVGCQARDEPMTAFLTRGANIWVFHRLCMLFLALFDAVFFGVEFYRIYALGVKIRIPVDRFFKWGFKGISS